MKKSYAQFQNDNLIRKMGKEPEQILPQRRYTLGNKHRKDVQLPQSLIILVYIKITMTQCSTVQEDCAKTGSHIPMHTEKKTSAYV